MIGKIVGGLVTILIGTTLLRDIADTTLYTGTHLPEWTIDETETPHRQTYKEYVEERLAVERMMK